MKVFSVYYILKYFFYSVLRIFSLKSAYCLVDCFSWLFFSYQFHHEYLILIFSQHFLLYVRVGTHINLLFWFIQRFSHPTSYLQHSYGLINFYLVLFISTFLCMYCYCTWFSTKLLCSDISPPSISCPANITVPADKNGHTARVAWTDPQTSGQTRMAISSHLRSD